jgi:hypothetical protein
VSFLEESCWEKFHIVIIIHVGAEDEESEAEAKTLLAKVRPWDA